MYYFAYGSNMNSERMASRCPGATPVGKGILLDKVLVERYYADIEDQPGSRINGLIWEISKDDRDSLDSYEGYPELYERYMTDIIFDGRTVSAIVYEMTPATKLDRNGKFYPPAYREICSQGAITHGIENGFKLQDK
jgi:hypothetical protein